MGNRSRCCTPSVALWNSLSAFEAATVAVRPARSTLPLYASRESARHPGNGGHAGYMTSAGVTLIADGTTAADERPQHALTNDTSLGILRYAESGYESAEEAARRENLVFL